MLAPPPHTAAPSDLVMQSSAVQRTSSYTSLHQSINCHCLCACLCLCLRRGAGRGAQGGAAGHRRGHAAVWAPGDGLARRGCHRDQGEAGADEPETRSLCLPVRTLVAAHEDHITFPPAAATAPHQQIVATSAPFCLLSLLRQALWQLKGDGSALPAKPCGPPTEEGSASGKAESSFSMVAAKSTKWPGAVTVAREGKMCTSIYCG